MSQVKITDKEIQEGRGICNPYGKRLYTLKEAAQYLGRTVWGVRELVWSGIIPVVRNQRGRKIFLDILDLEKYVSQNKTIYR